MDIVRFIVIIVVFHTWENTSWISNILYITSNDIILDRSTSKIVIAPVGGRVKQITDRCPLANCALHHHARQPLNSGLFQLMVTVNWQSVNIVWYFIFILHIICTISPWYFLAATINDFIVNIFTGRSRLAYRIDSFTLKTPCINVEEILFGYLYFILFYGSCANNYDLWTALNEVCCKPFILHFYWFSQQSLFSN